MFPTAPIVQEQNMAFSQHFHMSQMYGTTKRERVPATVLTKDWILSETEEWRISKVLGRLKDSRFDCTQSFHPSFPSIFRRRLLTGRSLSNTGSENTLGGRLTRGRTGQLLRMFESSFAIKCDQRLPLSRVSRNMGETALEVLFPLRLSKNSGVVWEDKLDAPDGTSPTTMGERPCISVIFEQSKDLSTGTLNSKNVPPRSTSLCEVAQMENAFATETLPTTTCGVHASNAMFSNMTKRTKQRGNVHSETLSLEPNKKMGLGDELTQPFGNSLHVPLPSLVGNMSFVCPEGCAIDDNREHPTTGSDESEQKILLNDCFEHEQDEFLLPSQHDSFSDDSDDEESASLRSESYANVENTESRTLNVNSLVANRKDEVFRLPTPSSSSEEESADEQDYDDLRNETVTAERLADITQRSQARVRFSLESSTCDATLEDRKISLRANPKSRKRILAINDTPESGGGPTTELPMIRLHSGVDYSLSNTQDESSSVGGLCQDLMCAKCQQGSLTNENPIISCDGYGTIQCGLAVHVACYELPSNETSKIDQKEWRCDVCNLLRSGGQQTSLSCATCRKKFGHMKVSSQGNWKHLNCNTNLKCGIERAWMDRLTKHQEAREPLRDSSPDENAISLSESLELKRKRRRQIMQFIDYEAQASGDDVSSDGREGEEVIAIEEEEEEFTKDFINDSSQLGYTQDELDQASAAGRPEGTSHRTLDAERDHIFQFATPRLNTRTRNRHSSDGVSGYSSSNSPLSHAAGESFRGLGNMHFIRSVLEHHRQGGTANEIESFYRNMEADEKEEIDGDSEWPS